MDRRSPPVSPSVVAQIFMIQKASVTCATLFMPACMCGFLLAGFGMPGGHRRVCGDACVGRFGLMCRRGTRGQCALVPAVLDAVLEDLAGLGVHADFVHNRAVLDVEGIAQPAAAL